MSIERQNGGPSRSDTETAGAMLRFGAFEFHTAKLELSRSGRVLRLQTQPARLLLLLLTNAGDLVTRDAIYKTLWQDGVNVDAETAVNRCVRQIRAVLDDDIASPRYIKTIPRLGYTFIAAIARRETVAARSASGSQSVTKVEGDAQTSIVVLPFANLSGETQDEYFGDGLAEELTNVLAQVEGLRVIARTSAFAYKGKNKDVRKIAETLGVSEVLEGSVRRSGERLRVTVQLVRASDGAHRLSKRYDYGVSDIFAMQDEISADVSRQLRLRLESIRPKTRSNEAYKAHLEGRFHWNRYSRAGFTKGLECFELASKLDCAYAAAYTGIAQCMLGLIKEAGASALELLPKAASAARQALELDASDAEAHALLGEVALLLDYDWKQAGDHFAVALRLNPTTYVRISYAVYYLIPLGRTSEAIAQSEQVIANDPLNVVGHQLQASAFMFARDFAEAARCCARVLELNETFPRGLQLMAMVKSYQNLHDDAITWATRLVEVIGRTYLSLHALGMVQASAGNVEIARSVLEELLHMPQIEERLPTGVGLIYVTLKEPQNALAWLAKAVEKREPTVLWAHMLPRGSTLRSDARFQELLRRMNLPVN